MRVLHLLINPFQHPMRAKLWARSTTSQTSTLFLDLTHSLSVSLRGPGCLVNYYANQAGLELTEIDLCLSLPPECLVLGLRASHQAQRSFIFLNFTIQSHPDPSYQPNQILPLQVSATGRWRGSPQKSGPEALHPHRSHHPNLSLPTRHPFLPAISLDSCRQGSECQPC